MQTKGLKYYSFFATIMFVIPVLLQIVRIEFGLDELVALISYGFILLSFIYNYVDSKQRTNLPLAFTFDNSYKLDVFSYLLALGLFIEFVSNISTFIRSIFNSNSFIVVHLISLFLCAIFALLSGFYFISVGISYGTRNYDFREFKMYHIVILLWTIFKLLTLFGQAIRATYDINAVLMHLSIMVMAFFFYYFLCEVENEEGASYKTLLFSRMCAYCSGLYAVDRLILIIEGSVKLDSNNTYFALTSVFVCLFSLFFEKSILHNTTSEGKCC